MYHADLYWGVTKRLGERYLHASGYCTTCQIMSTSQHNSFAALIMQIEIHPVSNLCRGEDALAS